MQESLSLQMTAMLTVFENMGTAEAWTVGVGLRIASIQAVAAVFVFFSMEISVRRGLVVVVAEIVAAVQKSRSVQKE